MEDSQTQASIAASLLGKRRHQAAKEADPKAYSESQRAAAKKPRPGRRKNNPQVKNG